MGHALLAIPPARHAARARNTAVARPHFAAKFVEAGRILPGLALSEYQEQDRWEPEVSSLLRLYRGFGNFSELNFSQVGHGIGYYDARTAERTAAVAEAKPGDP